MSVDSTTPAPINFKIVKINNHGDLPQMSIHGTDDLSNTYEMDILNREQFEQLDSENDYLACVNYLEVDTLTIESKNIPIVIPYGIVLSIGSNSDLMIHIRDTYNKYVEEASRLIRFFKAIVKSGDKLAIKDIVTDIKNTIEDNPHHPMNLKLRECLNSLNEPVVEPVVEPVDKPVDKLVAEVSDEVNRLVRERVKQLYDEKQASRQ
jgi:hypothetical protein